MYTYSSDSTRSACVSCVVNCIANISAHVSALKDALRTIMRWLEVLHHAYVWQVHARYSEQLQ
jgi:hypothetical protein